MTKFFIHILGDFLRDVLVNATSALLQERLVQLANYLLHAVVVMPFQ